MRAVLFGVVILLLACNNQQPIKEQAKPQPAHVAYKAKTQAELMAYTWKGSYDGTSVDYSYILTIDKDSLSYKSAEGYIDSRKIKWVSDTSFSMKYHYDLNHGAKSFDKRDTLVFYSYGDGIDLKWISKKSYIKESMELHLTIPYYRYEKR